MCVCVYEAGKCVLSKSRYFSIPGTLAHGSDAHRAEAAARLMGRSKCGAKNWPLLMCRVHNIQIMSRVSSTHIG